MFCTFPLQGFQRNWENLLAIPVRFMRAGLSIGIALTLTGCAWNVGGSLDLRHRREVVVKAASTQAQAALPGTELFSVSWLSGWPQILRDSQGAVYWRLRDGKASPDFNMNGGDPALYALVLEHASRPLVDAKVQYV